MPVPVALAVAATAYSAYSSYRQTQIGNAQKEAQADVAEINADTAELEGDLALKAAIRLESDSRRNTAQLIGTQRAAMSASGFATGEGSFANILEVSTVLGEMDAATILYEGELTQYKKRKEAESLRQQASALRRSKGDPLKAGLSGGLSTAASLF